ncbi:MAG: hypothetical protein SOW92_00680 [Kiritimatiellia bacterium]|nr:hypothetical protein [Kiritimatiellia bacterium]
MNISPKVVGSVPSIPPAFPMSEVNYRRNGQKYSSSGHCWGLSPKVGKVKAEDPNVPKPKSSRERRAMKKGK